MGEIKAPFPFSMPNRINYLLSQYVLVTDIGYMFLKRGFRVRFSVKSISRKSWNWFHGKFWLPENPISGILEITSSLQVHVLYAFRILIGTIKNHMPEKVTVSINRISWFMYLIYGHFMFQLSPANLSWILQHIPVPNV